MSLSLLFRDARRLGLGELHWEELDDRWWSCTCTGLGIPHRAEGRSPRSALSELVRFATRIR